MITYFVHFFSFNLWHSTFNNFAVELFSVNGQQIGLIQSLREIPGFLGFTIGFVIIFISEPNLAAISTVILGLGLIATGLSRNFLSLILSSIFMSIGFHYYYTVNSSMVIKVSPKEKVAHTLGKFRSTGSISSILAMVVVFLLVEKLGYRSLYYSAGGIAVVFGLYLFTQRGRTDQIPSNRKIIFRKKYWLYYVLSFLEGGKKHISSTFTIFLMVSVFQVSARNISLLFMINSIITSFTHQRLGNVVDDLGERNVLSFYYLLLIGIYLGLAYIQNVWSIFGLFVLARVALGFTVALNSYFQKIAPPEEITSNVSLRTTLDHIAAIFVPLIGGFLWTKLGYQATFLLGVGIVAVALVLTRLLEPQKSYPEVSGKEAVQNPEETQGE